MKLPLLLPLVFLVSCGTSIPLSTGLFKTYADADTLAVNDGAVSVVMTGVNHSRVNQMWSATVRSALADGLKTARHAITVGGVVDVAKSVTGLAKDNLAKDAAVRQAEIGAQTRAAEMDAANEALRITTPAN